jgi:glucoamylase
MTTLLNAHPADGGPGIPPRWAHSDKDAVGTAYSALSDVWFTISKGTINEVYYPTVDRPQIRDLQFLVGDGTSFVVGERELNATYQHLDNRTLGFAITLSDPSGRFRLFKEVITAPYHPCLLVRVRLEADAAVLPKLRLFVLLAPHLEVGGRNNTGNAVRTGGGTVLSAHKGGTWLVLGANVPFTQRSCGYVGTTDGWQDLKANFRMSHAFDSAGPGNIALTGEIDLSRGKEFVLGLAFGDTLTHALVEWTQSLAVPFDQWRATFIEKWQATGAHVPAGMDPATGDGGRLARLSHSLILAHEDKRYDGAVIASLSIPWGETHDESDLGGYHLVWTRDLFNSTTGLLAAGDTAMPLRALIYLACTQRDDGGFYQNFWINGQPYWKGVQLDETAFPILLAWHLRRAGALEGFDPYPLVRRAAGYLVRSGPVTPQDRWEENGGFSPSTLAAVIAGLVCAATFARERGDKADAQFLEEYADFLEARVDRWTTTRSGTLLTGVSRHYVRLCPADPNDPHPGEDPDRATLAIRNLEPGTPNQFPAKDVVDGGFLELVRYGIRRPADPLVEASLRVIDAVLAVDTPGGRCWRRYDHDGYGQRPDGGPFVGWGLGHAWPVLTGERGHYELAAGRDAKPFLRTMEALATETRLLPEQVWSLPDLPRAHMRFGKPTGGATPLVWAHGEYLKLCRSVADGRVFDLLPEVAARYLGKRSAGVQLAEVWTFRRQPVLVAPGGTLRILAAAPFRLRWSLDEWGHTQESAATVSGVGVSFVDLALPAGQQAPVRFTFFWDESKTWEGRDFAICVGP